MDRYAFVHVRTLPDAAPGRCGPMKRFTKTEVSSLSSTPVGLLLLIQFVLIAINSFFAAAEIAIVSLSEGKLRHQAEDGDKKAKTLLKLVTEPSGFLSTIQIAITLAGFLGSAFASDNFSDMLVNWIVDDLHFTAISPAALNTISVILITLILSYFTLVLGELVPKRIAMKKGEAVARFVGGPVYAMSRIFKPIVALLTGSVNVVLRLFGIDPKADDEEVTEDEIRMMVDIGGEKGAIEQSEHEMIENIFEFNNMTAADCMVHRTDVTAFQIDDDDDEVLRVILESGLSRYPVYDEDLDDVKGILNSRDYLIDRARGAKTPLVDLIRPAYFVPETVATDELFRDMQTRKNHLAIVVDEYGGTSGLITLEDLVEEIVGDINDEYDPLTEQDIQQIDENTYRVAGSVEIETLSEALDAKLPTDEEYLTLGGLIYAQLSTIPKDGQQFDVNCYGLEIHVDEVREHRVEWATIRVARPEQEQA